MWFVTISYSANLQIQKADNRISKLDTKLNASGLENCNQFSTKLFYSKLDYNNCLPLSHPSINGRQFDDNSLSFLRK
jgi:hypothetical protein